MKRIILFLLLAVTAVFPFCIANDLILRIMITIFIYSLLSIGNMVITGYCGLIHIGHAALYGIGAYTSAILSTRFNLPFVPEFLLSGLITGLVGYILALPCLRVQADFLSLVTLAFAQCFLSIVNNWTPLTNGPAGIAGIPPAKLGSLQFLTQKSYYYLTFTIFLLTYLAVKGILDSHTGRAMMAVRDDEISAAAMGINVNAYKIMSFIIGSILAGFAGCLMAHYIHFIGPTNFSIDESLLILQMCIIGGLGSISGAVCGSAFFTILPELLRPFAIYRVGIGGIIMLLVMLIRPQGILGSAAFAGSYNFLESLRLSGKHFRRKKALPKKE